MNKNKIDEMFSLSLRMGKHMARNEVFTTDTIPNNCIQIGQNYQFPYNR